MPRLLSCAYLATAMLTSFGAITPAGPAVAQDLELRIGPEGVTPRFHDNRDRRDYRRRDMYMERPGCDPADAEYAARDYGIRRPRVIGMTRHSVIVEGWTRDGRARMRFRNVPGCPAAD